MASLADLKSKFQQLKTAVVAKLPDVAATLALSAKAIAERKIKDVGFGALYSENRIPAWYLDGKELNAAGLVYLQTKKKQDAKNTKTVKGIKIYPEDYGVNWKEFRNAQGLQTGHVDLTYTGFMFSNMQPVRFAPNSDGTIVQAMLGATNVEDQLKMDYNRDRYGDFVRQAISSEDDATLQNVVGEEIKKIINSVNIEP
jgi:hypothetical protein